MTELRAAITSLTRAPQFVAVSVGLLAAALGVNFAVLSVVDRLLLRPLPYAAPERLVQVHLGLSVDPRFQAAMMPAEVTEVLSRQVQAFEGVAWAEAYIERAPAPDNGNPLELTPLTPEALPLLGVSPVRGRQLTADDAYARPEVAVLLAYEVWRSRFAAASDITHMVWRDTAKSYRVVGVLPKSFLLPSSHFLDRFDGVYVVPPRRADPGILTIAPFARLRPGVSLEQAQAEVDVAVQRATWNHPPLAEAISSGRSKAVLLPLQSGLAVVLGPYPWLVTAAAWTVLILGALNLSLLLLMRMQSRRRDMAMRAALGASPLQLVRAVLLEAVGLVVLALAIALFVAAATHQVVMDILPAGLRTFSTSPLEWRFIAIGLAGVVVLALVAATGPMLAAMRVDAAILTQAIRFDAPRRMGASLLVGAQSALAVFAVLGATVALPPVLRFLLAPMGWSAEDLFVVSVEPPRVDVHNEDPVQRAHKVASSLEVLPRVLQVSVTRRAPFEQAIGRSEFWQRHGMDGAEWEIDDRTFLALGTSVLAGRSFLSDDVAFRRPLVVLNKMAVRSLWPGVPFDEVVGNRMALDTERTVVGVVDDLRSVPGVESTPALFLPLSARQTVGQAAGRLEVLVRMQPGAVPDVPHVRRIVTAAVGTGGVSVRAVAGDSEAVLSRPRFLAVLFTTLGAVSLLMVGIALYALATARLASKRTTLAVRVALGARPGEVLRRAGGLVAPAVASGIVVGAVGAWMMLGALAVAVPGIPAVSARACLGAAMVTFVTAAFCVWLAIRPALRVNPAEVFRQG